MPMDMANALKDRLKLAVKKDGRSARAISIAATGKPDTVRDIIRGKIKSPRGSTIHKLARELKTTFSALTGHRDGDYAQPSNTTDSFIPALVVGLVQAGTFMDPDEYNVYDQDSKYIPVIRDSEFPDIEPIAFEVVGDSIDRECRPGGYAVCLPFDQTGLEPRPGMWVVAERRRGSLIERTIKRISANGRTFELHPSSNNPKHKPIRFPSAEPSEEVVIYALVRRFLSPALTF